MAAEISNNDKWLEGEIMDLSSLPEDLQRKTANYKAPSTDAERWADVFGGIDDPLKGKRQADIDLDPSIYEELARRDPEFRRKWNESKMEEVTIEFKRKNSDYYIANEKNYERIIRHIRRYQLQDMGIPLDNVMSAAYTAGLWTVENLTAIFKSLLRQGALDVPEGKSRPLSKSEQFAVIADVRANDLLAAMDKYLLYSYSGQLPCGYASVRAFAAAHPDLVTAASWFIFEQVHAGEFAAGELTEFKRHMRGVALPTVLTLEQAFPKWQVNRASVASEHPTEPEVAPRDPNTLSATELDEAIAEARKDYRQNH